MVFPTPTHLQAPWLRSGVLYLVLSLFGKYLNFVLLESGRPCVLFFFPSFFLKGPLFAALMLDFLSLSGSATLSFSTPDWRLGPDHRIFFHFRTLLFCSKQVGTIHFRFESSSSLFPPNGKADAWSLRSHHNRVFFFFLVGLKLET